MSHVEFFLTAFDKWHKSHPEVKGWVLDVGCRNRVLKTALEERGFTWTGVDHKPTDENDDLIYQCTMEKLIVQSNMIDLVLCCHSFEHCEDPISALREFKRVLKPGGYLFIGGPYPCYRQLFGGDEDHIFVLNELQLQKILKYVGYEDVTSYTHEETEEQNHTVCAAGKKTLEGI